MIRGVDATSVRKTVSMVSFVTRRWSTCWSRTGNHASSVPASLYIRHDSLFRPLPTSKIAEMLEISLRHLCDITTTKDTDLKVLDLSRALNCLHARGFQSVFPVKVLEDDVVRTDEICNFLPRLAMRDQIFNVTLEKRRIASAYEFLTNGVREVYAILHM
jgi:hypothetical protein